MKSYKCSFYKCDKEAQFLIKVGNKLRPCCFEHYHKLQARRLKGGKADEKDNFKRRVEGYS